MSDNGQPANPEAVEIEIDWSDEPMPVYANGAQVIHTHREFALAFTEFAPFTGRRPKPYPPRQGEMHERARVVSTVRLTPDVFFQLIAAGAENWNKFVDTYGKAANADMPKFTVVGAGPPPSGIAAESPPDA